MDSIQAAQAVAEWAEKGQTATPPAWEELPSIPLYMDQVILYLGESLELFQGEGEPSLLTSSMINNYVKNGLIPHPQKKKYAKEHLAGLMAVCMLKQVLSIQDMKTLLGSGEISPQTYQLFRQAHTAALQETQFEVATGEELAALQSRASERLQQKLISLLSLIPAEFLELLE